MNVRAPIESSSPTAVLSVSFNSDSSCFAVGLESGICNFNAGIGLVQMMGKTNYLALVGGGKSPKFAMNKAIVWDDMKGKVALEIAALSPIRSVRLARERIVVVLQTSVRVYSFAKPPDLLHIYETAENCLGLCCLSENKAAFPGRTPGQVQLVDLVTGSVNIIPAHSSALKALQLSCDGELLASASETGTLVRVYSTRNCARIAELRRGIDPATIFSLAFSPSGAMLACTSDKAPLHIFDIPNARRQSARGQQWGSDADAGKWGILGRIPLMPRVFSDVYSFASVPFEAGDDGMVGGIPFSEGTVLGTTRPPKGVIGWICNDSLAVVGAGQDARWEKFVVLDGDDGKRHCVREGWKRYLGNT
ncbi:WD repeat domain phosphoinositide-interacting protein [Ophiocordyceps sinensis CO18]|uniref:WD repeat domain phosphoinositide-interacting protein n=1 Tax=Ophiocordyceps sinensis (strain Co18 / CGMCC 3.14243) TaxID=911162 RepID=T5AJC2_OPHSC|nr:WD repeat domain phosphoinositide-interacting protein [Ophiocordyceps sinensis CO18]